MYVCSSYVCLLLTAVEILLLSAGRYRVPQLRTWWGPGIVFQCIYEMTEVLEKAILCYSFAVRILEANLR